MFMKLLLCFILGEVKIVKIYNEQNKIRIEYYIIISIYGIII